MQERKSYFDNHPKVDTIHFTSDGLAFIDKHEADAHATSLSDKKVDTVTREEIMKDKKEPPKSNIPNGASKDNSGKGDLSEVEKLEKAAVAANKKVTEITKALSKATDDKKAKIQSDLDAANKALEDAKAKVEEAQKKG